MTQLKQKIEMLIQRSPHKLTPLHGGSIGEVYRVDLPGDERIVAKVAQGKAATLDIEGYMLNYLRDNSNLPVPAVIHAEPSLLLMEYIAGDSQLDNRAQAHAADLLADLHSVRAEQFGLERDTLIGGLHQPNPQTDTWIDFFRDQRLLYMARVALDAGRLPAHVMGRIETLASQLGRYLDEPAHPALIHGDMWTTNILAQHGRITGFVDPALYYAHPEIELAFSTLFGTFNRAFFDRYNEISPIAPGFFAVRRDLYNLYPLLVHVRLFGGSYVSSITRILSSLGV